MPLVVNFIWHPSKFGRLIISYRCKLPSQFDDSKECKSGWSNSDPRVILVHAKIWETVGIRPNNCWIFSALHFVLFWQCHNDSNHSINNLWWLCKYLFIWLNIFIFCKGLYKHIKHWQLCIRLLNKQHCLAYYVRTVYRLFDKWNISIKYVVKDNNSQIQVLRLIFLRIIHW